jgi:hypothetical protein
MPRNCFTAAGSSPRVRCARSPSGEPVASLGGPGAFLLFEGGIERYGVDPSFHNSLLFHNPKIVRFIDLHLGSLRPAAGPGATQKHKFRLRLELIEGLEFSRYGFPRVCTDAHYGAPPSSEGSFLGEVVSPPSRCCSCNYLSRGCFVFQLVGASPILRDPGGARGATTGHTRPRLLQRHLHELVGRSRRPQCVGAPPL